MNFPVGELEKKAADLNRGLRLFNLKPRKIRPHEIHQLRVTVTRLRAILGLFEKDTLPQWAHPLKKSLRKLSRKLGQCRQWDVLYRDAREFGLDTQGLENQKLKARQVLLDSLGKKKKRDLSHRLGLAGVVFRQTLQWDQKWALKAVEKDLRPWLRKGLKNKNEFHQLRKKVKRVRYALEAMKMPARALKGLQGKLGRIHDLELMQEMIEKCESAHQTELELKQLVLKTYPRVIRSVLQAIEAKKV